MEYKMSNYGQNIIADEANEKRANDIIQMLESNDTIKLDFSGIQVSTTFAIKRILRPIVEKYGFSELFRKLIFCNVPAETQIVISTAIEGLKDN